MCSRTGITLGASRLKSTSLSQYLSLKVAHHAKRPEPTIAERTIAHEIHGPPSNNRGWHAQRLRISCRASFLTPSPFIQVECTIQPVDPLVISSRTPASQFDEAGGGIAFNHALKHCDHRFIPGVAGRYRYAGSLIAMLAIRRTLGC